MKITELLPLKVYPFILIALPNENCMMHQLLYFVYQSIFIDYYFKYAITLHYIIRNEQDIRESKM